MTITTTIIITQVQMLHTYTGNFSPLLVPAVGALPNLDSAIFYVYGYKHLKYVGRVFFSQIAFAPFFAVLEVFVMCVQEKTTFSKLQPAKPGVMISTLSSCLSFLLFQQPLPANIPSMTRTSTSYIRQHANPAASEPVTRLPKAEPTSTETFAIFIDQPPLDQQPCPADKPQNKPKNTHIRPNLTICIPRIRGSRIRSKPRPVPATHHNVTDLPSRVAPKITINQTKFGRRQRAATMRRKRYKCRTCNRVFKKKQNALQHFMCMRRNASTDVPRPPARRRAFSARPYIPFAVRCEA